MPRTKSYSTRITKILEAARTIVSVGEELEKDFDNLSHDSARLKEIQPLLNRLIDTTKAAPGEAAPAEAAPAEAAPINVNPKKRAKHINKKLEELNKNDKSSPAMEENTEQSNSISVG